MPDTQIVYKPWGKEEWLELNEFYCYKRIYINAGHKTSYQVHREKLETNYIISGQAEVWLEDDTDVKKYTMGPGEFFTVYPGKKHRVIAITDIILQEVSTPQVDDVIRLEDDTDRSDGRIQAEQYRPALCILTAGRGTRIEKYSSWINKGLLPIHEKASISHLIEKVPEDYDIVVALGYLGDMVKDYLLAAHPERDFTFVEVDDYEGKNSGPGYSLRACQIYLQRPFIWAVSDCYFPEGIPPIDGNWLAVCQTTLPEIYSTVEIDNDVIVGFKGKREDGFDYAFIGVASIYDYEKFWTLLNNSNEAITPFFDYSSFTPDFKVKHLTWSDVGTLEGYQPLMETNHISLEKLSHSFPYHVGNRFIKLFADTEECMLKVNRSYILNDLVPNIIYEGDYVFAYEWLEGKTLYDHSSETQMNFINWMETNVWDTWTIDTSDFVKDKTLARAGDLLEGIDIPWTYICEGRYTAKFHGDLQFDNVVLNKFRFYLIDWRDKFDDYRSFGDIYYDLGKLYGGILIDYKAAKTNDFRATGLQIEFETWAEVVGYDLKKIRWHTALIWLSMVPLHPAPFSDILHHGAMELIEELNAVT